MLGISRVMIPFLVTKTKWLAFYDSSFPTEARVINHIQHSGSLIYMVARITLVCKFLIPSMVMLKKGEFVYLQGLYDSSRMSSTDCANPMSNILSTSSITTCLQCT